jgi:serine/threonine-protein kinase
MNLESGARIGPYAMVRRLGRGTTGVVYHATHREYGDVALKMMADEVAADESARARFVREAQTLVRLRHRNIVTIFEGGVHDGVPFIAMELLAGTTLASWLGSGETMPLQRKLDIVIQLCDGLQFAHERGVIHRDVKPANVWVMKNGGVKLLDFGTARVLGSTLTHRRDLVGSAAYMAPEQLAGSSVDGRADVFAAGAILYELIAGRRPFEADAIAAVMNKILHAAPPPLAAMVPGVPADVIRALDTALQKDVSLRYQEAAEFASELRLARYGVDTDETVPAVTVQAVDPAPPSIAPEQPTVVIPRAASRVPRSTLVSSAADSVGGAAPPSERAPGPSAGASRETAAVPPAQLHGPEPRRRIRSLTAGLASAGARLRRDVYGSWAPHAASLMRDLARRPAARPAAILVGAVALVVVVAFLVRRESVSAPVFRLEVRSVPAGAAIEIDGAQSGHRTPAALSLTTRPRRLRLMAAGHETVDTAVTVMTADAPTVLAFTLRRLVRVESKPPGARILINGADTGVSTPADIPVAPGSLPALLLEAADRSHAEIQLTDGLLKAGLVSVVLAPSRRRTPDVRQADLDDAPAGRPGTAEAAGVEAAGPDRPERPGSSPVAVHAAGSYPFAITGCGRASAAAVAHDLQVDAPCTLRLRAPQYYLDETRAITASAGRVEFAAPGLARVQLRSKHEGCTLLIDDHAVGSPPVDLELAAGTYRVVIQCRDRSYTIRALTIEPGQSSRRLDDFLQ